MQTRAYMALWQRLRTTPNWANNPQLGVVCSLSHVYGKIWYRGCSLCCTYTLGHGLHQVVLYAWLYHVYHELPGFFHSLSYVHWATVYTKGCFWAVPCIHGAACFFNCITHIHWTTVIIKWSSWFVPCIMWDARFFCCITESLWYRGLHQGMLTRFCRYRVSYRGIRCVWVTVNIISGTFGLLPCTRWAANTLVLGTHLHIWNLYYTCFRKKKPCTMV